MVMEIPRFKVGPPPHHRTPASLARLNYAFLTALVPVAFVGSVAHAFGPVAAKMSAASGPMAGLIRVLTKEMGLDSGVLWLFGNLGLVAMAVGFAILAEYLCQVLFRQPYHVTNGHGALMGLVMALLMPPTVPWWVLFTGVFFAIVVGKQIFGGIGGYPMHPAMVGWLALLLSWPQHLYPVGMESLAAVHLAPILVTAAAGLALVALGYVRWHVPVGLLLGVLLFSLLLGSKLEGSLGDQFLHGHVVLAAFFLATDPTVSPANRGASFLYGLVAGGLVCLIRAYGIWPDAVPFAVLLSNAVAPLLDRIRPRVKEVVIQDG